MRGTSVVIWTLFGGRPSSVASGRGEASRVIAFSCVKAAGGAIEVLLESNHKGVTATDNLRSVTLPSIPKVSAAVLEKLREKQETGRMRRVLRRSERGLAEAEHVLTVNVDRTGLLDSALHGHSSTQVAWAQRAGFHR